MRKPNLSKLEKIVARAERGAIDEVLLAEATFQLRAEVIGLGSVTVIPARSQASISTPEVPTLGDGFEPSAEERPAVVGDAQL